MATYTGGAAGEGGIVTAPTLADLIAAFQAANPPPNANTTLANPAPPTTAANGARPLSNGSIFNIPMFDRINTGDPSTGGFGYAGLADQMADANGMATHGAGNFNNNAAGRYAFGASPTNGAGSLNPNASAGGGLLGFMNTPYNPFAGRGNGPPGAPPPAGGPPGAPPPGGPPGGGIFPPPAPPGPPGGIVPPRPPNAPGPVLNGPPPNIPPGSGGIIRNQPPPTFTPPPAGSPGLIRNQGGGLLSPPSGGTPGVPAANFQPPSAAVNTTSNAELAQRATPQDMAELISRVGETAAHQMMSYYGPLSGGAGYNPQKTADLNRGESGGISALMPAIKSLYEANGIIVDGKWAKKQDNAGNWVPV